MRPPFLFLGLLSVTMLRSSPGVAIEDLATTQQGVISHGPRIDPATPLSERVTATPPDVLKMFADEGSAGAREHVLTPQERRQLSAALEALPPLHRRVLRDRLAGLSFVDGMPNTALTSTLDPHDSPRGRLFHITVRAGIFRENASEWATKKERTCFDLSGSPLTVSIDAGAMDALTYVMLHESTHIVDALLKITPVPLPEGPSPDEIPPTEFTRGIWSRLTLPSPPYRAPLLQGTVFNAGGKVLPIARAMDLYASLQKTPFASLYASHAWTDDLAEYLAIYHWTQVLKQPYRIIIRDESGVVFEYEPMKSDLVRGRFEKMAMFYKTSE